jgi:hypothetical protein
MRRKRSESMMSFRAGTGRSRRRYRAALCTLARALGPAKVATQAQSRQGRQSHLVRNGLDAARVGGTAGNVIMKLLFAIVLAASYLAGGAVASAQFPALPGLPDPIPAPLPPPPQTPIILGPLTRSPSINGIAAQSTDVNAPVTQSPFGTATPSAITAGPVTQMPSINAPVQMPSPSVSDPAMQTPSPGVLAPPPLVTFSDRLTQCIQLGSSFGLSGSNLNSYSSVCAN